MKRREEKAEKKEAHEEKKRTPSILGQTLHPQMQPAVPSKQKQKNSPSYAFLCFGWS
jgi:hypothetical protein